MYSYFYIKWFCFFVLFVHGTLKDKLIPSQMERFNFEDILILNIYLKWVFGCFLCFLFFSKCMLENFLQQPRTKTDVVPFLQARQRSYAVCQDHRAGLAEWRINPIYWCKSQCSKSTRKHHLWCGTMYQLIFLLASLSDAVILTWITCSPWACYF